MDGSTIDSDNDNIGLYVAMGIIVCIVLVFTIARCCFCTRGAIKPRREAGDNSQQDNQGLEMVPPNNEESQNQGGLRKRTKDGSSSSEEEKYSSRETVAMDDVASGNQNQSVKSNKKIKTKLGKLLGLSQTKGDSRTRSASESEGSYVVYLANNESPEDTVPKYYMSSDNRIRIKNVGKKEEGNTDGEPNRDRSRYEECHCMASESNINNSASACKTQDFNEDGNTVIKNDGTYENNSENRDNVDNGKCCKDIAGGENKSEVDTVSIASSAVGSIDQYYSAEDVSRGGRIV